MNTRCGFAGRALRVVGAAMLLSVGLAARPAAAQRAYSVTDLGTLGADRSDAYGINQYGQVAGYGLRSWSPLIQHAFLWSGGQMKDLGALDGEFSLAQAISDSGQVVGYAEPSIGSPVHAFLWSNGVMHDLGTLGGPPGSGAYDINSGGQVVGDASVAGSYDRHACLWQNGTVQDLGTLGGGRSCATGINGSGDVVGWADVTRDPVWHAFLWRNGVMSDLGALAGGGSQAEDLNDAGAVVGTSQIMGAGGWHACLWSNGTIRDLGTLGGDTSWALGINNAGTVVGTSVETSGFVAFVYQSATGMVELNTRIDPTLGWFLAEARDINDAGQIVGTGWHNGQQRAVLLTPIKLASLTLTPATVPGSKTATGLVTLSAPAPSGGIVVKLTNTNGAASVPASVTVPAGATSAAFSIPTTAVTYRKTGTVTAGYDGVTLGQTLTVRPIGVLSVALTPNPVTGGDVVTGKVVLECPAAPGDITVSLLSSNALVATVSPASVTVKAGGTTQSFTVYTTKVGVKSGTIISATANGVGSTAVLTLYP